MMVPSSIFLAERLRTSHAFSYWPIVPEEKESCHFPPPAMTSHDFLQMENTLQLESGIPGTSISGFRIFEGSTSIRRLTFGGRNPVPAWTPDGRRIVFQSDRDGEGLYWQAADGSGVAEHLSTAEKDSYHSPLGWTPDGKTLAFYVASPTGGGSVWTLNLDGDRKPKPLVVYFVDRVEQHAANQLFARRPVDCVFFQRGIQLQRLRSAIPAHRSEV